MTTTAQLKIEAYAAIDRYTTNLNGQFKTEVALAVSYAEERERLTRRLIELDAILDPLLNKIERMDRELNRFKEIRV